MHDSVHTDNILKYSTNTYTLYVYRYILYTNSFYDLIPHSAREYYNYK